MGIGNHSRSLLGHDGLVHLRVPSPLPEGALSPVVPLAERPDPHFRPFSLSIWVPLFQISSFRSVWIKEFDSYLNSGSSQVIYFDWVSYSCYFGVNSARTLPPTCGGRRAAVSLGDGGVWSMANLDCYIHPGQSNHSLSPCQKSLTNTISSDTLIYIYTYMLYL